MEEQDRALLMENETAEVIGRENNGKIFFICLNR